MDFSPANSSPNRGRDIQPSFRILQILLSGNTTSCKRENFLVGHDAVFSFANHVRNGNLSEEEIGHMVFFLFKLGARRALDFATFFEGYNTALARHKRKQAEQFGQCHTLAVRKSWDNLANVIEQLGNVEEDFRIALCAEK